MPGNTERDWMPETLSHVGIDVSKNHLDVALLKDGKLLDKKCDNNQAGFAELVRWLTGKKVERAHICLEATGKYGEEAAVFLHEAGHLVSVVNPARAKAFVQAEMLRTKTDKSDARSLARFCKAMNPAPWQPPKQEAKELQEMSRRLDDLQKMLQMEENRLAAGACSKTVQSDIQKSIAHFEKAIASLKSEMDDHINGHSELKDNQALLQSIKGIGERTSSLILAELGDMSQFASARQAAAYCGLVPSARQSGTSVRTPARMSKKGNHRVRKGLYMAACSAARYNPLLAAIYKRLREKGLKPKAALGAVMRKLIHLAFGVLKHRTLFNPAHAA